MSTLSLAYHPGRRAPYEAILDHQNFHHVSPAYAKRFQKPDETEEQYVERLRQELEDKFIELGPDTVIGCMSSLLSFFTFHILTIGSHCGDRRWCDNRGRECTRGILQGHEIRL